MVAAVPRVERYGAIAAAGQGDFRMQVRAKPRERPPGTLPKAQGRAFEAVGEDADMLHSTVTLFAKVARLVDVGALEDRDVIGQQLRRRVSELHPTT